MCRCVNIMCYITVVKILRSTRTEGISSPIWARVSPFTDQLTTASWAYGCRILRLQCGFGSQPRKLFSMDKAKATGSQRVIVPCKLCVDDSALQHETIPQSTKIEAPAFTFNQRTYSLSDNEIKHQAARLQDS